MYWQFWQFEVQKLAYMLILAAGGMIPYLSSVGWGGKTQMMTKPSTKEFKFAVRLTILGNLIIVVILIFIFIFFIFILFIF